MGGYPQKGEKPLRNYKNRKRYITVGFRVSPEQRDELYKRIHLTGRSIQDYMLQSGLNQQIVVVGNERLRRRIIERLEVLEPKLDEIAKGHPDEENVMTELRMIYEITETWE